MKVKVAAVQFASKSYKVKDNLKTALNLAKNAVDKKADIIVFPELFDSGYCVEDKDANFALNFKSANLTLEKLQNFAKTNGVHIVACSIQSDENDLFDTAYVISPDGSVIGKYRKIYLWANEVKRFKRGDEYPVFELNIKGKTVKIGLQICYEIGFGEGARILALKGAEIIIYPAAFGRARRYIWDIASRARAIENGVFVVACGRSGKEFSKISKRNLLFAGCSRIVSPRGEILDEVAKKEGVAFANLDLKKVEEQRKNVPYLKDLDINLVKNSLEKIEKSL